MKSYQNKYKSWYFHQVLKNCDSKFFKKEEKKQEGILWVENNEPAMFVAKPCVKIYNALMETLKGMNGNGSAKAYLRNKFGNFNTDVCNGVITIPQNGMYLG